MAIKILLGGSPCTHWSIAQKYNRETQAEGIGWELFKNYLIAKEKFKPDIFLYENNKSASQAIKDQIATELGVGTDPNARFTYINSSLVSAQNRQRFYVTNFGDIEQPEDRGILLKDILENGATNREKSHAVLASAGRTTTREYFIKQQGNMAFEAVDTDELMPPCDPRGRTKTRTLSAGYQTCSQRDLRMDIETEGFMGKQGVIEPLYIGAVPENKGTYFNGKQPSQQYRIYDIEGKGVAVTTAAITNVAEPVNLTPDGKSQTIKAQYQNTSVRNICCYTSTYGASGVAEPIRVGCPPRSDGEMVDHPHSRIYSTEGKSTNLNANGGGIGAKTGLYAIPVEFKDDIPTKAVSCADGKTYTVYEVKDGFITIKGKQYPIKLKDGYYIIRKLTVTECCRLQTLPDDYMRSVSASQGYKGLGNGWTAEVIIHILNHALKDVPRDEEIIVLSMYDGIGTGRYVLDKMGFTNVKYHAYEIDKYAITVSTDNYPDIIQHGDAFAVRNEDWRLEENDDPTSDAFCS